ncbi:MAG: hypothetical protein WDN28_10060 [Chthoniobacter sp.]
MNEVWERFSYYGMKAILVLFMVTPATRGGLGMSITEAGAAYGLYSCLASTTILPGGWIADVLWGQRKAHFWGGVVIVAGHLSMAAASNSVFFFAGLGLIAIGNRSAQAVVHHHGEQPVTRPGIPARKPATRSITCASMSAPCSGRWSAGISGSRSPGTWASAPPP